MGLALPLLVALWAVRVAARGLGPEAFSLILLAWTVTGYFGVFDLGFGRAIAKLGAEAEGNARLKRMVSSAVLVQLIAGTAIALVGILLAPKFTEWLRVPAHLRAEAVQSFRVLPIVVPAIMVSSTYRGALEALRRFGIVNALRIPLNSAAYVITLIGVAVGAGPAAIIGWIVIARVAGTLAHAIAFATANKQVTDTAAADVKLSALFAFGGWVSITNGLAPLINYLDRFLVGNIVSLSAITYYATPYELTSKLMILPGSLAPVLLPALSAALARNDGARSRELIQRSYKWSAALLIVPSLLLVIFAPQILHIWAGADFAVESATTLRLLAVAGFLNGVALIPFTALEGLGRPDLVAKYHIIELPVYVVVAVLMIRAFGINGAAFAWVLRTLVGLLVLAALSARVAKRHALDLRWGLPNQ